MTHIKFPPDSFIKMRSGHYKGRLMREIPSGYLRWIAENFEEDRIAEAADEEYRRRTDENDHWDD